MGEDARKTENPLRAAFPQLFERSRHQMLRLGTAEDALVDALGEIVGRTITYAG